MKRGKMWIGCYKRGSGESRVGIRREGEPEGTILREQEVLNCYKRGSGESRVGIRREGEPEGTILREQDCYNFAANRVPR
jgi:hypothetical protein